jgi:hypothetical protein
MTDMSPDNPGNKREASDSLGRKSFTRAEIEAMQKRDQELINAAADRLNEEMEDVLRYQVSIDDLFSNDSCEQ